MFKKLFIIVIMTFISTAMAQNYQKSENTSSFGEGVSATDTVLVSELLANPESYLGKSIAVKGNITSVCEKRGCWMKLSSDKKYQEVTIKVNDGDIVFPVEAKGKNAVAEGTLELIEMPVEQAKKYLAHRAEEEGKEFDPESVTEPYKFYRIRGTGAEIEK